MELEVSSNLQDRIISFLKNNLLISTVFFIGLIFLVIGLIQFLGRSSDENNSIKFESDKEVKAAETSSAAKIFVDVSGEVRKPGVYELDPGSRIKDALDKADGLTFSADKEYISKTLNLAQKLTDGAKIYIPGLGEEAPIVSNSSLGNQGSQTGLISINSGSQSELESLPGIGPVTAQKIINLRPYSSINELLDKKAVGKSVFEKIKDLVSL